MQYLLFEGTVLEATMNKHVTRTGHSEEWPNSVHEITVISNVGTVYSISRSFH